MAGYIPATSGRRASRRAADTPAGGGQAGIPAGAAADGHTGTHVAINI
jgi:hypothetical protein